MNRKLFLQPSWKSTTGLLLPEIILLQAAQVNEPGVRVVATDRGFISKSVKAGMGLFTKNSNKQPGLSLGQYYLW